MPEQTVQQAREFRFQILDAMRAIRAIHPKAVVSVELRGEATGREWVDVTVLAMPDWTFGEEERDIDGYPNCWFGRGGYLNVSRYADADFAAALATALELIRSRSAVSA